MEETFSSLVCFQLPRSGPSLPFGVSKTQMSMAGLWGLCCPWLGGKQSWWVQAGKARKSTGTRLRLCTEMHGCTHKMLHVHLRTQQCVPHCMLAWPFFCVQGSIQVWCPGVHTHVLDGEGAVSSDGHVGLHVAGSCTMATCALALRVSRFTHSLHGCMYLHALYTPLWPAQRMKHPFLCLSQRFGCLLPW